MEPLDINRRKRSTSLKDPTDVETMHRNPDKLQKVIRRASLNAIPPVMSHVNWWLHVVFVQKIVLCFNVYLESFLAI